jgi:hypothetical protein
MIPLGKVRANLQDEERDLNRVGLDLMGDVSKDTIMLFTALQAIHKRQGDAIMLGLNTSNG